jgi:hypothetical protein
VQVVNLVAQGTIEEGMLSLLGFKRAVFAGVLDGGDAEVFLGGSRLARFMETVEKTTATSGAPPAESVETAGVGEQEVADDDGGGDDGDGAAREDSPVGPASPAQADDPLSRLLAGGLALLGGKHCFLNKGARLSVEHCEFRGIGIQEFESPVRTRAWRHAFYGFQDPFAKRGIREQGP